MKHTCYLLAVFLCCCIPLQAKEKTVERPSFSVWSSASMEIQKIVLSDTATVFFIEAHYRPNMWIMIAADSYLLADGKKYMIRSGSGMELGKEIWMPDSGTRNFQMIFPPLPENTTEVSFTEDPSIPGGFSIWGIRLDGKQVTSSMSDKVFPKENPVLETPVLEPGTAVLRGKLLKYSPMMNMEGSVYCFSSLTNGVEEYPLTIEADGTFRLKIPLLHITSVGVRSPFMNRIVYLKPGEETVITVNLPEYCRAASLLRKDEPSLGKIYYFEGALAALNNEVCNLPLEELHITPGSQEEFMQMVRDIATMNADRFKAYWLQRYYNGLKEMDKYPDMSEACRTLLKQDAAIATVHNLLGGPSMIEYAYRKVNNIPQDSVLTDYLRPSVDRSYYDFMPELVPNNPLALYNSRYGSLLDAIQHVDFSGRPYSPEILDMPAVPFLAEVMKTDSGILFDLIAAQKIVKPITEFVPLTDEQLAKAEEYPSLKSVILLMNDKLRQTIADNKKLSGYIVNRTNIVEVPEDEVFRAIITPYRGKVVFVDFWATWCGPCKEALKQAEPVKEAFEGKDIVFLYLAGENSPVATWKQMISKIKGEHYRMSQKQWDYVSKTFGVRGVPSYMLIAKDGAPVHFQTGFMGAEAMKQMLEKELAK